MGFMRDLSVGNKAEGLVQMAFAKHGVETTVPDSPSSAYDLQASLLNRDVTMEVKFDLFCARSGNIAIEFFNPKQGKPSGVQATKADIWVHLITKPMSIWVASVVALKNFIKTVKPHKTVACGGDDNSSMYLYKQEVIFDSVFTRIDECNTEDFFKVFERLLSTTNERGA